MMGTLRLLPMSNTAFADLLQLILAGEAARLGLPFKPFQPSAESTDQ